LGRTPRWEGCRLGGRGELDRYVVVSGPSQLSGPDGPAEQGRPAGQSAGCLPGLGHRATRSLRQARGTDLMGTGEPGHPVAGLGSLLGALPAPGEPDGSRRRPPLGWRRPRRLAGPGPPRTTPRAPNRSRLVSALTCLSHTGRAGRAILRSLQYLHAFTP
jgi:hypothetical protein